MSSRAIDKRYHENEYEITKPLHLKDIIIPYSQFYGNQERFIYTGEEKIPFQNRHPLYKIIMLNEFRE
jgi:hypothetical protein